LPGRNHPALHGTGFVDLDLFIESRRQTDAELQTVVDVSNFCARAPSYSMFQSNDWIRRR
jgi:hypothetical protein